MNNKQITRVWIALLFILVLAFALWGIGKVSAAPDQVLPGVSMFGSSKIVVHWSVVPPGWANVSGWVCLQGANNYEQDIELRPVGLGYYVGSVHPVPVSGLYYLYYGYFHNGDEVYPIADLPGDPIVITLYQVFMAVMK